MFFNKKTQIPLNYTDISQIFNIHTYYNFLTNKFQNYFVLPNNTFNFAYANRDGY